MSEIEREIKGSPLTKPIQVGVDSYLRAKFFSIPGHIVDFNSDDQTATVQIGIERVDDDGTLSAHPEIIMVPVGFDGDDVVFGHKISPGTEGLIHFSQRGVDNWMNSGGIAPPSTMRKFDITDAFFDPKFRSLPNVIRGFKNDGAWMATKDGSHYFHLKSDGSMDVDVVETNWKTGAFNIDSTAFNVKSPTSTFTGNITATETITGKVINAIQGLFVAGLNMLTHNHSGVSRGTSNTDGPQ
ncbi:baseplate spike [Vibrio phage 209E38-1]